LIAGVPRNKACYLTRYFFNYSAYHLNSGASRGSHPVVTMLGSGCQQFFDIQEPS
jgi:hypothetical protein